MVYGISVHNVHGNSSIHYPRLPTRPHGRSCYSACLRVSELRTSLCSSTAPANAHQYQYVIDTIHTIYHVYDQICYIRRICHIPDFKQSQPKSYRHFSRSSRGLSKPYILKVQGFGFWILNTHTVAGGVRAWGAQEKLRGSPSAPRPSSDSLFCGV